MLPVRTVPDSNAGPVGVWTGVYHAVPTVLSYHPCMDDTAPKSAYEIAMARLRQKDAEQGVTQTPLTDEQRASISEIRNFYKAKLAEQEVLHQSSLARTFEPEARALLERDYQYERQRLTNERDSKIEKVRAQ
jgi:hypothetical protein